MHFLVSGCINSPLLHKQFNLRCDYKNSLNQCLNSSLKGVNIQWEIQQLKIFMQQNLPNEQNTLQMVEEAIIQSQTNYQLLVHLTEHMLLQVLEANWVTHNPLVHLLVPSIIAEEMKHNFLRFQQDHLQLIYSKLLNTFLCKLELLHGWDPTSLKKSAFLHASALSYGLVLCYDKVKDLIFNFILGALESQQHPHVNKGLLMLSEAIITKVEELVKPSSYKNYAQLFTSVSQDYYQNFLFKLIPLCARDPHVNFKERVENHLAILSLQFYKDVFNDSWLCNEVNIININNQSVYTYNHLNQSIVNCCKLYVDQQFVEVMLQFIDDQSQEVVLQSLSLVILNMRMFNPNPQIMVRFIHLANILLQKPITIGTLDYIKHAMLFDISLFNLPETQKLLQDLILLFKYLINESPVANKDKLDRILEVFKAFVINIRSQTYEIVPLGFVQQLLQMLLYYKATYEQCGINVRSSFNGVFKTICQPWTKYILSELNKELESSLQNFLQNQTELSLANLYQICYLYQLVLFGSLRSLKYMWRLYKDALITLKVKPYFVYNLNQTLPKNFKEDDLKVFLDDLKPGFKNINMGLNEISKFPQVQPLIAKFNHKFIKHIIFNSSSISHFPTLLESTFNATGDQLCEGVNQRLLQTNTQMMQMINSPETTQITLKYLKMISKCQDQGEIAVFNNIIISRNSFLPLYSFNQFLPCHDGNYSTVGTMYGYLNLIGQIFALGLEDRRTVHILLVPFENSKLTVENVYPIIQMLRGLLDSRLNQVSGEAIYDCCQKIGLFDYVLTQLENALSSDYQNFKALLSIIRQAIFPSSFDFSRSHKFVTDQVVAVFEIVLRAVRKNMVAVGSNRSVYHYQFVLRPLIYIFEIFTRLHTSKFIVFEYVRQNQKMKSAIQQMISLCNQALEIIPQEDFQNYYKQMTKVIIACDTMYTHHKHLLNHTAPQFLKFIQVLTCGLKNSHSTSISILERIFEMVSTSGSEEQQIFYQNLQQNLPVLYPIVEHLFNEVFKYNSKTEKHLRIIFALISCVQKICQNFTDQKPCPPQYEQLWLNLQQQSQLWQFPSVSIYHQHQKSFILKMTA